MKTKISLIKISAKSYRVMTEEVDYNIYSEGDEVNYKEPEVSFIGTIQECDAFVSLYLKEVYIK